MKARCHLEGPCYSGFRLLYTGHKIDTLNWVGEKGGLIVSEYLRGRNFGEWGYIETKSFILDVLKGKHCIGVEKRADILNRLFEQFQDVKVDYECLVKKFYEEYRSACRSRGILLSEFDFANP